MTQLPLDIKTDDISSFVELVEKMRATQRLYYRHRSNHVLNQAKDLEKQVDAWIATYKKPAYLI